MLDRLDVLLLSLGYLMALFGIAYMGDRISSRRMETAKPLIISLALTIYCSAWSFYGNTGQAVYNGWHFPPTFLGAIITLVVGAFIIRRLIALSKQHNITSVADFIASQFGRSQPLAIMVTLVALIALLPYISLQLKAISDSFHILTATPAQLSRELTPPIWLDNAFYIALILALFTIMFGTRHINSKEHHNGLMIAIAFESMIKLAAFCAVAYYVCFQLFDGAENLILQAAEDGYVQQIIQSRNQEQGFLAATVLGIAAIICLPRQFHALVVENNSPRDLRTARWVLPLYLTLFAVALLPIAYAGLLLFQGQGISPEQYILRLPLNNGNNALALFAYIGGLSAGSSMVIVACVAIATMISNEIVMPVLLRRRWLGVDRRTDLSRRLRVIRSCTIFTVMLLSYSYYRWLGGQDALGAIGLLALALVAQFAPAILAALYWPRGHAAGVMAGIATGFCLWCYTLLLPALAHSNWISAKIINLGPWGIDWLRPQSLFNFESLAPISNGVLWSLTFNILVFVAISLIFNRQQAGKLQTGKGPLVTTTQLQTLAARFLGKEQARLALHHFPQFEEKQLYLSHPADAELVEYVENLLAGVIGSASAHHVIARASQLASDDDDEESKLLDESSKIFHFSRGLLQASIDNISQGISVIDDRQQMVAWNQRYLEIFPYLEGMIHVGRPVEDLVRCNAEHGDCGSGDIEQLVEKRMNHLRQSMPYVFQRTRLDGTVLETQGNLMPGGGFVTTYTDITDYTRIVSALQESKQHLEQRVSERTAELTQANRQLHDANENKTRFLAAAGHDIVQPLNAAKLFATALQQRQLPQEEQTLVGHLASSINSAEALISELLDIAKLDAGAVQPEYSSIDVNQLLKSLCNDYQIQAEQKGLRLHIHPCSAAIYSDSGLLRRVLQNLIANAVRYTDKGRVVIGCRRQAQSLRIEVWDTGVGIPANQLDDIFVEFKRLRPQQTEGTGLGLATVQRLCKLLSIPLSIHSTPGKGTVFSVSLPLSTEPRSVSPKQTPPSPTSQVGQHALQALRVVCIDNEKAILEGMDALLSGWGCQTEGFTSAQSAQQSNCTAPDVILADYHLDNDDNGIDAVLSMYQHWGSRPPCIIISADRTDTVKAEAEEKGFHSLRKPIKPAALRALLTRLLIKLNNPSKP